MKVLLQEKRLLHLAAVMMLSCVMIYHTVQRVDVYGVSMYPNCVEGDIILAGKVCPYFSKIRRSDAVAFQHEYQDGELYARQVIGLPDEIVQIVGGQVYIGGALLDGIYAMEPIERPRWAAEPMILGKDRYFLLGGNRNNSSDNRDSDIGNISANRIISKAGVRIWRRERQCTGTKLIRDRTNTREDIEW